MAMNPSSVRAFPSMIRREKSPTAQIQLLEWFNRLRQQHFLQVIRAINANLTVYMKITTKVLQNMSKTWRSENSSPLIISSMCFTPSRYFSFPIPLVRLARSLTLQIINLLHDKNLKCVQFAEKGKVVDQNRQILHTGISSNLPPTSRGNARAVFVKSPWESFFSRVFHGYEVFFYRSTSIHLERVLKIYSVNGLEQLPTIAPKSTGAKLTNNRESTKDISMVPRCLSNLAGTFPSLSLKHLHFRHIF